MSKRKLVTMTSRGTLSSLFFLLYSPSSDVKAWDHLYLQELKTQWYNSAQVSGLGADGGTELLASAKMSNIQGCVFLEEKVFLETSSELESSAGQLFQNSLLYFTSILLYGFVNALRSGGC